MSKTIRSLFVLASLACLPLLAAEKVKVDTLAVKTLPAQVYSQLQKGKNLSLVWKGPDFEPSKSFKIGSISWKAPVRIGEVLPYLNQQLPSVASPTGYYILNLVITDAKASYSGIISNTYGYYVMEGQVVDPNSGKVVAAFVTREKAEWVGVELTLKAGLDRTISGIMNELFK